ncbi:MAG: hypothetical protein R2788_09455 [Saprospiraceae bacterium]
MKILGYDQTGAFAEWVDVMFQQSFPPNTSTTAIHWYASTYEVFPEALQYAKAIKAPGKIPSSGSLRGCRSPGR